jgi:nitroimidazol reductase NimA-like FMN-containing flavoprotein (pyridoxamine 5'-phosphate oxidase superfamily)
MDEIVVDANRVLPLVPDSRDEEIAGWKEWAAMAEARIEELEAMQTRVQALADGWEVWEPAKEGWVGPLEVSGYSRAVKNCATALRAALTPTPSGAEQESE